MSFGTRTNASTLLVGDDALPESAAACAIAGTTRGNFLGILQGHSCRLPPTGLGYRGKVDVKGSQVLRGADSSRVSANT
jgi:hypothetical protein